ncbi:MAG: glycosyltransferase family 39 protein [Timaviella obliquedivisa GSE-PSE-MK23-08B]|jgi:uncharacterized membrane protein|nr:glycosyltransferase family 39 protein [Timaviella obliquedivisa GSE-PSE-MK23-08B]
MNFSKPLSRVYNWRSLVILLLLLGLFFRIANLDRKIYWVDEVATSIRVAGYTRTEIINEVTSGKILHPQDLLNYQKLTPQRDLQDTFRALSNSPEHAPLYFLIVRAWAMVFGSSAAAMRSPSVLFSLIALPCLYGLTLELFQSHFAASLALSLAAISPFFVAYAQEARPYSLWLVAILLSSLLLLKAVRLNQRGIWVLYALSLVFGFYTSLLSIWVALGQAAWIMLGRRSRLRNFAIAFTSALFAFTPWLWIMVQHWQRLQDNTTWMRVPMGFLPRVAIGLYSVVIGFVDFPVYVPVDAVIIAAIIADIGLLTLIGFSFYFVQAQSVRPVHLFIFTLAIATPLCLVVIDWMTNGQSSTAPRYLIPCQIAVQLAIAFVFSHKLRSEKPQVWKMLWVVLISMGILSCAANLETSPKYQKIRNLHNLAIATVINQVQPLAGTSKPAPLVIAESTQTMDLLSLSRNLAENIEIKILSQSDPSSIPNVCQQIFLFNPSKEFRAAIVAQRAIVPVYQPKLLIPGEISLTLWAVKNDSCSPKRMAQ